MELFNNDETIQKAFDESAGKAISSAFVDYKVQSALKEKVVDNVIGEVFTNATIKIIEEKLDIENLTKVISAEINKNLVSGVVQIIRKSFVVLLFNIRKGNSYLTSKDEDTLKQKIEAELKDTIKERRCTLKTKK